MLKKIHKLYNNLWNIRLREFSRNRSFILHQLRVFALAIRYFIEDKIQLRASALTFYSLLSIVPVLAMGFAIAKGFGYDQKLKEQLIMNFSAQETVLFTVIDFAENLLNRTKEGYLAGVGAILLLWSVMKVLGHMEQSFNDIWQIKKSRDIFRKFSDYTSIMLIAPLLFVASSSYSVWITDKIANDALYIQYLGWFIVLLNKIVPYILIWLLLSMLYIVMPNTRVQWKYGIIAGIIAGTLFNLVQVFYIRLQMEMFSDKYNAIYGAFATLPLFLLWIQISWLIVLFGAEIAFSYQHVEDYEFESVSQNLNNFNKRVLCFLILHLIIKNFEHARKPLSASQISRELDVPIRASREVLTKLLKAEIITDTSTEIPYQNGYLPALDINKITIKFVHEKLEKLGNEDITAAKSTLLDKLVQMQESFIDNIGKSSYNVLLKDV